MQSIIIFLGLSFLLISNNAFAQIEIDMASAKKIKTAYGPEDIVLDLNNTAAPRLLLSCTQYKGSKRIDGGIWFLDLKDENAVPEKFELVDYDPAVLRPHGIFLQADLLYVISHEGKKQNDKILVFKVDGNKLLLKNQFPTKKDPVIKNTNDLFATPEGDIYFSNPAPLRKTFFKRKVGYVGLIRNGNDTAEVFIDDLVFPNGVYVDGNTIFITDSTLDQLFAYPLSPDGELLPGRKALAEITAGDNISKYKNSFLIANHPSKFKFGMHAIFKTKSPSSVFQYNLDSGAAHQIFKDNGKLLSASSTAVVHGGYLYIAQVMKDFILKIKVVEEE